ncbi:ubiquitin-protein ligase [Lipomyces japonicus]|uniref:ubiquitin-protein ligase n=1 Tax=Lipomyces japonicus TaxID=56871 RepID=UPI0034CE4D22
MSARLSRNSPTVRRVLQEAKEIASDSSPDIYAAPTENNLLEWHFVIRGPSASVYEQGIYHGRIVLPSNYPLSPPSFRFLQDTGRFDVNTDICLSISNFHAEEWLPSWGIRTALVALRAFMLAPAEGAVGGLDNVPEDTRQEIASRSRLFVCKICKQKNEDLLSVLDSVQVSETPFSTKTDSNVQSLQGSSSSSPAQHSHPFSIWNFKVIFILLIGVFWILYKGLA